MASYTSSQSGNFNSSATWGGAGVPSDADTFTVSAGHIVTVSDDQRPANGFADSFITGKLHISGTGKIRMNGILRTNMSGSATKHFVEGDTASGCYLRMDNGAQLEFKGSNADVHYLHVQVQQWSWLEVDGTNPNSKTTLSSNATISDTSLSVASSTGFSAGDWVSVHVEAEDIDDWEIQGARRTEGFHIHDISGNTIYIRQFVSPTATITSAAGKTVTVDNPDVFRENQKVIFGTGANRNIRIISQIDPLKNRITFTENITGSVVGETIYRTGTEKYHASGDSVQKVATAMTSGSSSGTNTITVASTAGMSDGDTLWIEANNSADTAWDYESLYTISSISGNTITLTSNLSETRETGAKVAIWSRDTAIKSIDVGNTNERPFIWVHHTTTSSMYYRRVRIRNCDLSGMGSNSSNSTWYRGVGITGRMSYENNSYSNYASSFEGNVWRPNNRGNNACVLWRDWHQPILRNNICYDGQHNFWRYASGDHVSFFNNISSRSNYTCLLNDGFYGYETSVEYNLFSRSDDYGVFFYHFSESSISVRHNYITHHENRPIYFFYQMKSCKLERNYIDYYRYWPYLGNRGGDVIFLNCYLGNGWDNTGGATTPINGIFISDQDEKRPRRGGGDESKCISINHNFKKDDTVEWYGYIWRKWDYDEQAWFVRRSLSTNGYAGWVESVYVPANTTVYLAAEIKFSSGNNGTRPYFAAWSSNDYYEGAYVLDGTSGSKSSSASVDSYKVGFLEESQYSTTINSDYERKTLTIQPQKHDYFLSYAVYSTSTNAGNGDEGWYQKPYEAYLDSVVNIPSNSSRLVGLQTKVAFGNSTNVKKTRLGGRIK